MQFHKNTGSPLLWLAGLSLLCFALPTAHAETTPNTREIVLRYDFNEGSSGWLAGFSDYSLKTGDLEFLAEVRPLPDEIDSSRKGYFLQGMNRSDDLFMYLKRPLNAQDGLTPNTQYSISIQLGLASNAPTGAIGIGGAPGESVYLKAGVSAVEPVSRLIADFVGINIDKGEQSNGGRDMQVIGNIANGRQPEPGTGKSPYVFLTRIHHLPELVSTDERGVLWVVLGTDSGYEGLTGLYYESVVITLRPIRQQ